MHVLALYHRPALELRYRPTLQLGIRDFTINFFFLIRKVYFSFDLCTTPGSHIKSPYIIHSLWHTQEFCSGGGSTNSGEERGQRERGSGGGSPLVRSSGNSCNLVQEISFH